MLKQYLLLLFTGITLTAAIIIIRPVPILPEERLSVVQGTISQIFEAGEKDIVFTLRENSKSYYINRGMEQGLSIEALKSQLLNEEVTIKYPNFWTPISSDDIKHLSKLIYKDQVIFTELEADLMAKN